MEIKKKIIVCGDSFCSAHNYERDHFSQILEDTYGYSVINLARGGTGTVSICFQLQEAIKLLPDVVVYCRTAPGRIEVPTSTQPFDLSVGLKNFAYPYPNEASYGSPYVGNANAPFFSHLISSLITQTDPTEQETQDQFVKLSPDLRKAVQMYMMFIYDENLKREIDNWVYNYWENQITVANIMLIPFSVVGKIAYEFSKKTKGQYPRCYHTDRATQEIVAKNTHEEIQRLQLLKNML
jgi:hypothetical protein